jgi:2-haloacid dehalogenase
MARVCVFDVNETLLDLGALDTPFQQVFGTAQAKETWFTQVLQSAMVATLSGFYADFGTIGSAALDMVAARLGVHPTAEQRRQILGMMRRLPPHAEVERSLQHLHSAGLRLAALTNSSQQMAEEQLHHAGLAGYFEQILSVEAVRRFKPAPEVYHMAAERLGVVPERVRLIAAHEWDVAGAMRAGCAGAFVARAGKVLDPLMAVPDIIGADMAAVAEQLLRVEVG